MTQEQIQQTLLLCVGCRNNAGCETQGQRTFDCRSPKGSKPKSVEELLRKAFEHNSAKPKCPVFYSIS